MYQTFWKKETLLKPIEKSKDPNIMNQNIWIDIKLVSGMYENLQTIDPLIF